MHLCEHLTGIYFNVALTSTPIKKKNSNGITNKIMHLTSAVVVISVNASHPLVLLVSLEIKISVHSNV